MPIKPEACPSNTLQRNYSRLQPTVSPAVDSHSSILWSLCPLLWPLHNDCTAIGRSCCCTSGRCTQRRMLLSINCQHVTACESLRRVKSHPAMDGRVERGFEYTPAAALVASATAAAICISEAVRGKMVLFCRQDQRGSAHAPLGEDM